MIRELEINLPLNDRPLPDFKKILTKDRLLRMHPHWVVPEHKNEDENPVYSITDHATGETFELDFDLRFEKDELFSLDFKKGKLTRLAFVIKNGSLMCLVDGDIEDEENEDDDDLMKDTVLWIGSIREYLRLYLKSTPNTLFFRFFMNHVLLKMKPSQRKICLMMFRFTLLECLLIIIIGVGYYFFSG